MKRNIREWLSIQLANNPSGMILAGILAFNIFFFLIAAIIISSFSLTGTENMSFLEAAFCTITMILDPGCIQFVIDDIGRAGAGLAIICLIIIIVGMISFTGAVIGYITNYISSFVAAVDAGSIQLDISNHIVILNWNTRASEIINDLLYSESDQTVVVLTGDRKHDIEKEIDERLADTIQRENQEVWNKCQDMHFFRRLLYMYQNRFKRNVTVVVREGDVFSSKQLNDISLLRARMIVILGEDINNAVCKFGLKERNEEVSKGNSQTIKTLMQVADITDSEESDDNQKVIVEITDDWTWELVEKIIKWKLVDGKCNIVPLKVNSILGQLLSQFSLMPELNLVYRELFSNQGSTFFSKAIKDYDDQYIGNYMRTHNKAIPLTVMEEGETKYFYYAATREKDFNRKIEFEKSNFTVQLNKEYWIEQKNIVILGHNSKCHDIMNGFKAFRSEWNYNDGREILRIIVVDDENSLKKMNYYKEYPFVERTVAASIYDKELILKTIDDFIDENQEDTSILILSDDDVLNENTDANALANLVYVQDIVNKRKEANPTFDIESIDVIVEIIDPKHHDIVSSYSTNNVVISNRYISKMITQIGEKESLFNFYNDILTYDEDKSGAYESKEIYTKKVNMFFEKIPEKCSAYDLIQSIYDASTDPSFYDGNPNPTIAIGYVKPGGNMVLFGGNLMDTEVELDDNDKLIVFSNH